EPDVPRAIYRFDVSSVSRFPFTIGVTDAGAAFDFAQAGAPGAGAAPTHPGTCAPGHQRTRAPGHPGHPGHRGTCAPVHPRTLLHRPITSFQNAARRQASVAVGRRLTSACVMSPLNSPRTGVLPARYSPSRTVSTDGITLSSVPCSRKT